MNFKRKEVLMSAGMQKNERLAISSGAITRKTTRSVVVANGERQVVIGGNAPVVIQSMTNTDTVDAIGTQFKLKS